MAVGPLEGVEERPHQEAGQRRARRDGQVRGGQMVAQEDQAIGVVLERRAVP
ncbi:hypothetical protein AB0G06_18020 [Nonomuraea dietziae]|uniref:hypothetical protein n=1 Tax=Nonomuraea dietziae TaxID=65515 RepID=UPI003411CF3D